MAGLGVVSPSVKPESLTTILERGEVILAGDRGRLVSFCSKRARLCCYELDRGSDYALRMYVHRKVVDSVSVLQLDALNLVALEW